MSDIQYTIRSVPKPLDDFLRRDAIKRHMSLNKTVLDYIEKAVMQAKGKQENDLSWFIGSGALDDDVLRAIKTAKEASKRKQARDDEISL